MIRKNKLLSPGTIVPRSGIYKQLNTRGNVANVSQGAMNAGKRLPPTKRRGYKWQLDIATRLRKVTK